MNASLSRALALAASLVAGPAMALGLGDIVLQSRLGEPLRAEIPVITDDGVRATTRCFSLVASSQPELPSATLAKLRLIQRGSELRLQITGRDALFEPVFVVAVRIDCGEDLQREYILMPEAPPVATTASALSPPAAPAERQADAADQTPPPPRPPKKPARRIETAPTDETAPTAPTRRRAAPPPADHLVLGAAEANGSSTTSQMLDELDGRLLRMETTLHTLHREVVKMDEALALARQSAEAGNQRPAPLPAPAPPPALEMQPRADQWLELLLSALAGGAAVFACATLLTRWQERRLAA